MEWFTVSKAGLAKLLDRRGKQFVLYELIANGWDQKVTTVKVSLTKQSRVATITVEDDDPNGFMDLSHAWTLFAESEKKQDATKRGRFNVGEKLVLALCTEAEILTTTGGVRFDDTGRHTLRRKREAGSVFTGKVRMTNKEFDECVLAIRRLIPPANIVTTFVSDRNDFSLVDEHEHVLPVRTPIAQFEATLPTEIADAEGVLRRSARKTTVSVYEPLEDEVGTLYEMGIPVVPTGDTYHVDIGQKVPLNIDRDNVQPAYLRDVRTLVLNAVHERIHDQETANTSWVRDALSDENIAEEAIQTVVKLRFGEKAVAYDPSDAEANKRAVSKGYTVITGSQLSKDEWGNVRRAGVLTPAGRLFPTPKPYSDDPNAPMVKVIPETEWNEAERRTNGAIRRVANALLGFTPEVCIVSTDNRFNAAYGGKRLDLNRRWLGHQWFTDCLTAEKLTVGAVSLLIHELGHEFCRDHLSSKYYDALTDLGAKLAHLVSNNPALLRV